MAQGKLYRSFIILQEDERGHSVSSDKPLSGYAKIEVKNEKCKITFYVQNVKKDDHKCCMALICGKKDNKQIINLGSMNINEQGKSEVTCEYSASDIAELGFTHDKISGAALCKEIDGRYIYLMVGFMTGEKPKDDWKRYKMLHCKNNMKMETKMKSKHKEENKKNKKEHLEKEEFEIKVVEQTKIEIKEKDRENEILKEKQDIETEFVEDTEPVEDVENIVEEVRVEDNIEKEQKYTEEQQSKFDKYEEIINETASRNYEEDFELRGSVGEFFESIVDGFENVRNKFKDMKFCKWFKIPVNNLDVMCNVSNYNKYTTLYYPMINYYPYIKKYGYFMVGFKCDETGKVQYLVYAIPGKKDKMEQPYNGKSGFVTWIQDSSKDVDMGYWLMFYDFKNSMVVVPMK